MLKRLTLLIEYCATIADDMPDVPQPCIVADKEQGTIALNTPAIAGLQAVIALPLASLAGDCDNPTGSYTVVIFALEKRLEQTGTRPQYVAQYLKTVGLLGRLLGKFLSGMGGTTESDGCPVLNGMEIAECVIAPEAGIFGGWNGYSATITLK